MFWSSPCAAAAIVTLLADWRHCAAVIRPSRCDVAIVVSPGTTRFLHAVIPKWHSFPASLASGLEAVSLDYQRKNLNIIWDIRHGKKKSVVVCEDLLVTTVGLDNIGTWGLLVFTVRRL